MRLLFLSEQNHDDIKCWSGTILSMYKICVEMGYEVDAVDNLKFTTRGRVINRLLKRSQKTYLLDRTKREQKFFSKQIRKRCNVNEYDIIFATTTLVLPFLNTNKPIILMTDAIFESMINYHPNFTNIRKCSYITGNTLEKIALEKTTHIIFASEWAKAEAIKYYGIAPQKISVINLGINLSKLISKQEVEQLIEQRMTDETKNILFVGADWLRKGGDLAIKVYTLLREQGVKCRFYIVGSKPTYKVDNSDIILKGFLHKDIESENNELISLYKNASIFFLPTRCEAAGISFVEASAYGVPVVGTNTGGSSAMVQNGVNGILIDQKTETAEKYVAALKYLLTDQEAYMKYSLAGYDLAITSYTWESVGCRVKAAINLVLGSC